MTLMNPAMMKLGRQKLILSKSLNDTNWIIMRWLAILSRLSGLFYWMYGKVWYFYLCFLCEQRCEHCWGSIGCIWQDGGDLFDNFLRLNCDVILYNLVSLYQMTPSFRLLCVYFLISGMIANMLVFILNLICQNKNDLVGNIRKVKLWSVWFY